MAHVQNQLTAAQEEGSLTQKQLKLCQATLTASKHALEAVMRGVNESETETDQKDVEERCLAAENSLREKLANTIESETQVCSRLGQECSHLGEELARAVTTEMEVVCRYQEAESELQALRRSANKESELMATCQGLRDDLANERDKATDARKAVAGEQQQNQELRENLRLTRMELEAAESGDKEADERELALQRRNKQLREELARSLSQTRDLHRILKELSSARTAESQAQEVMADCRRQSLTLQRRCDQMRDQLVGLFREDGRSS